MTDLRNAIFVVETTPPGVLTTCRAALRSAILERGVGERRTMLFVFEDGLAKWRYVTVGPENDRFVAILPSEETDMVQPGEIVLTDGHHYLAHDTRVRLVESVFAAGGRPSR